MIIMKFGGTSVQNKEAIDRVTSIIEKRLQEKPLVVVSAMSGVTRTLLRLAESARSGQKEEVRRTLSELKDRHHKELLALVSEKYMADTKSELDGHITDLEEFVTGILRIGELSARSKAKILSMGELMSSVIIAGALNTKGIKTLWMNAGRLILTDDNFLNARPDMELTNDTIRRIITSESNGYQVVLTQGFIASTKEGYTSVLGFEGSDYTAAIIGGALGADRVEIWTDVDGIRTADPRIIKNTKKIDKISYEEAAQMAFLGARVLHPLTIEPARKNNIPIYVLNSSNPDAGGTIVGRKEVCNAGAKSIACKKEIDYVHVKLEKICDITSMMSDLFAILAKYKMEISLMSISEESISFTADSTCPDAENAYRELQKGMNVSVYRDKGQISIIGHKIACRPEIIEILKSDGICMTTIGSNLMNVSIVSDKEKIDEALNNIHEFLFG